MSKPSDNSLPQRSLGDPRNLPSVKIGHTIIVFSVLFFLIIGYVTFFSVFISPPHNFVRDRVNSLLCFSSSHCWEVFESGGRRHLLQVPRTVSDPHFFLLCHRKLGGVAILPKLLKQNLWR